MKIKLLAFCVLLASFALAQKYKTRTGEVNFEASVPSFEEVAAKNKNSSAILDASNGNLAVLALVKGFKFKIALMEEHFNENYVDSQKYPKASFKGKVKNFKLSEISTQKKNVTIQGVLSFNGVDKSITTNAVIYKKGNEIVLDGAFTVSPSDFNITIPKVVSNKIAKTIEVTFYLPLKS